MKMLQVTKFKKMLRLTTAENIHQKISLRVNVDPMTLAGSKVYNKFVFRKRNSLKKIKFPAAAATTKQS